MVRPALGSTALSDFSGLTFLIVEDDRDSRGFLRELLRACGAGVVVTESGREAKTFVATMKFDLIVTDMAMPREDGATFLKWLRQQPADEGGVVPVVAVTAFYEQYPPNDLSGWAAYLRKPLDLENFVQTIAAILNVPGGSPIR